MEAKEKMKSQNLSQDFQCLINFKNQGKAFELAIPTPEHFSPLLYALALIDKVDETTLFKKQPVRDPLPMSSLKFERSFSLYCHLKIKKVCSDIKTLLSSQLG